MGPNLRYSTTQRLSVISLSEQRKMLEIHVILFSVLTILKWWKWWVHRVCLFVCLSHFYISGWFQEAKQIFVGGPKHQASARCCYFYVFSSSIILWFIYGMVLVAQPPDSNITTLDADRNLQGRLQRCIWWCDIGHNSHVFIGSMYRL